MKRFLAIFVLVACAARAQTTFYDDTFTGTVNTALSAHSITGTPGSGGAYKVVTGSGTEAKLSGSAALNAYTNAGFYQYITTGVTSGTADYTVEIHGTYTGATSASSTGFFLVTRASSPSVAGSNDLTGYATGFWNGVWATYRFAAGGQNTVGSTTSGHPTTGTHVWKVVISGSSITLYEDATQIATWTDTVITAANPPGLFIWPGSNGNDLVITEAKAYTNTGGGLSNGTTNVLGKSNTTASVLVGNASGGTPGYTYQWYRSTSNGFTPGGGNIVSGATSQQLNDTGLTANTTYYYINRVTDSAAATADTAQFSVVTTNNTEFAPNDAHIVYSPGNWNVTGTVAKTNCWGAYGSTKIVLASSTDIIGVFDNSGYGTTTGPIVAYSLDSGAEVQLTLTRSVYNQTLFSAVASGTHTLRWRNYWQADDGGAPEDYWNTPVEAVGILKLALTTAGTLSTPTAATRKVAIFGDSITRGEYDGSWAAYVPGDAIKGYAAVVGQGLNAEYAVMGMAGDGWTITGAHNVPTFPNRWNLQWSGTSRSFPAFDDVIVNEGTNDAINAASDASVTAAVTAWLVSARAATPTGLGTAARIWILLPFNAGKAAAITTGVTNYTAAHPSDTKVYVLQAPASLTWGINTPPLSNTNATAQTVDNVHLNAWTHAELGAWLAQQITKTIDSTSNSAIAY